MTKVSRFVLVAVCAVGVVGTAHATFVNDLWPSNAGEQNVWQIYNTLYGTNYTSSNDIPQVPDDVWFSLAQIDAEGLILASQAAYTQNFGWFQVDDQNNVTFQPVFSVPPGQPGDSFNLIPSGQTNIDGVFGFYDDTSGQGGMLMSSAPWMNVDLVDHMVAFYTPDPNVFLLAFEDIPVGHPWEDFDYNDLILQVSGVNVVPEPSSMILLGVGLAGIAVRRMRKTVVS